MAVLTINTCSTPSQLLSHNSCLSCLSVKELKAVILAALASDLDTTVTALKDDSACFCISEKQKLQAVADLMADKFLSGQSLQDIRETIKCVTCAGESTIDAALVLALCKYITAIT